MNKLSSFFILGIVALMSVSCYPGLYKMNLQMRQPSSAGFNFGGKELGVVYAAQDKDSVVAKGIAEGLASSLEKDYYNDLEAVGVYAMPYDIKGDYSLRDTLTNVLMQTNADVVFLVEVPPINYRNVNESGALPANVKLHIYDSMGQTDTVRTFSGVSYLQASALGSSARITGQKSAVKFLSKWEDETFYFYSYLTLS